MKKLWKPDGKKVPVQSPKSSIIATQKSLVRVNRATAWSLLFGGSGQIYLGQIKKGIILIFLSIIGLIAFIAPGVIIIILGMVDANIMAKRIQERGSVGEWEFFWNVEEKSKWKVLKIDPVGYSEKFIGNEVKRFYNARSPTTLCQVFRVKREWSQSYSIENEKTHSTTSDFDPKITESAVIRRSVQDVFRQKYSYAKNKTTTFEEDVTVSVPPWKNIKVELLWKNIIENWVVVMGDQFGQQIMIPVAFITKLTFDQRQSEFEENN